MAVQWQVIPHTQACGGEMAMQSHDTRGPQLGGGGTVNPRLCHVGTAAGFSTVRKKQVEGGGEVWLNYKKTLHGGFSHLEVK